MEYRGVKRASVEKNIRTPQRFFNAQTARVLKRDGIAVIPTDTLYGIVGSALSKKAVFRIYRLRKRNTQKPMIVLIGSYAQLRRFGIAPDAQFKKFLNDFWPGKVSVVLPCTSPKFRYLHRGTKSVAFRMPRPTPLRRLLVKTGPLVAPSANLEGEPPAKTIAEAKKYFGNRVDFYIDAGKMDSLPSTLVTLRGGKVVVLRKGA